MIKSVITTRRNRDLIAAVAPLWIPEHAVILDATYGKGNWWGPWVHDPIYFAITNDLNPDTDADFHVDMRDFDPDTFSPRPDVVFFDPPYLAKGGCDSSGITAFDAAYGLYDAPANPDEMCTFITDCLAGCARVVRSRGRVMAKCSDYISSGKYVSGYGLMLNAADMCGLKLRDLVIHDSGCGPQPPGRQQVHTRRSHSYLFLLEQGR